MSRIFRQPSTFGGVWRGLSGALVGSDPAFDAVAAFSGAFEALQDAPSVAVPVLATHSATQGSTFKIAVSGIWVATLLADIQDPIVNPGTIVAAIGVDNLAANLSGDPPAAPDGNAWKAAANADTTGIGAIVLPFKMITTPFAISERQAHDASLGLLRVLWTDGGGAAPDTGLFFNRTTVALQIHRIADLPAQIA